MRLNLFLSTFFIGIIGIVIAVTSAAAQETKFICSNWQGNPATVAATPSGEIPIIRWLDNSWGSEFTPQKRCEIVSEKFQKYHAEGTLKYMTTGRENGQNVVCVAQEENGSCRGRALFTLKPDANPGETLKQLMNVRDRSSGPINQSTGRVYINMDEYLQEATASTNSQPDIDINQLQPEDSAPVNTKPGSLW